jgi:hypothetical protein
MLRGAVGYADPPPAFDDVIASVDRLVRSIAPTATTVGDGVVPGGYALPEHPVPFLLLQVVETGVEVFVPATGLGWSDLEHALRVAVASADARSFPRARAVRWQRVGIVALLPWGLIAVTLGILIARAMGVDPEAPGSPIPGIVGIVVGVGGWVLTNWWAYRRFPPTPQQRAAASSADTKFLRANSATVGCLVGGAWFFLGGAALAILGPEASRGRPGQAVLVIFLIGLVVIPAIVVRYVRRRYPPDPQTSEQRLANRVMFLMVLAIVMILVLILIVAGVSGRFDLT